MNLSNRESAMAQGFGRHYFIALLAFCALVVALIFLGSSVRQPSSDGAVRYQTYLTLGEGAEFSKYSTVQPFLAKILDQTLRLFNQDLNPVLIPKYFELLLICGLLLLATLVTKRLCMFALLGALLPLSMMPHYLGQFFSEITSSSFLACGFIFFLALPSTYGLILGGTLAGLGLANSTVLLGPACAVLAIAIIGFLTGREQNKSFLFFLCISLIFGFLIAVSDLLIKGHLFNNPYGSASEAGFKTELPYSGLPGFSHPVIIGLLGSLFSFGKSVFLFNPFLIFLFVRTYAYKFYAIAFFCISLLIYSQWWAWYGGFSFGTRFYMFAIVPSLFVFLYGLQNNYRKWKALEPIAILLGFWLAMCGKHFGLDAVGGVCTGNDYAIEAFCWYVPEFTPLINPFVSYGVSGVIKHLTWIDYTFGITVACVYFFLTRKDGRVSKLTIRQ